MSDVVLTIDGGVSVLYVDGRLRQVKGYCTPKNFREQVLLTKGVLSGC